MFLYVFSGTTALAAVLAAYGFGLYPVLAMAVGPWVLVTVALYYYARFPPFYTYRLEHARSGGRLARPHILKGIRIHELWAKSMNDPLTDFGLAFKEVEIPHMLSGGVDRLRGWHVPAKKSTARTCIVCVHGAGRDRRNFLRHTPHLHEAGHGVLLCDLGEHGISDGKGWGINYGQRESYEVADMVRFARVELGYEYIVTLGTSMGAVSSILAAGVHAQKDDAARIDGVVAENPFETRAACMTNFMVKVRDTVHPTIPYGLAINASIMRVVLWGVLRLLALGDPEVAPGEPKDHIAAISPRPVLLMHGTHDGLVDTYHSENLHAAAKAPKDLWIAEGAVHTAIYDAHPEEWQRRVLALVDEAVVRARTGKMDDLLE